MDWHTWPWLPTIVNGPPFIILGLPEVHLFPCTTFSPNWKPRRLGAFSRVPNHEATYQADLNLLLRLAIILNGLEHLSISNLHSSTLLPPIIIRVCGEASGSQYHSRATNRTDYILFYIHIYSYIPSPFKLIFFNCKRSKWSTHNVERFSSVPNHGGQLIGPITSYLSHLQTHQSLFSYKFPTNFPSNRADY